MGRKSDNDKNRLDLIIPGFITGLGKVLTHGAKKYEPNNWQTLDAPLNRYYGAAMRHIEAWREGELLDPESGLPHLFHAVCNLMFLLWFTDSKGGSNDST